MAFSFSGSTLTITSGTETPATIFSGSFNLPSGNTGTYIDRVPGVENSSSFFYIFKAFRVAVASGATFSIQNSILFNTGANTATWPPLFANGGTIIIGGEQTLNSVSYPSVSPVNLQFKKDALGGAAPYNEAYRWGTALIQVFNGGSLFIYGADIIYKEGMVITNRNQTGTTGDYSTATINIQNSRIVCKGTLTANAERARFLVGGNITLSINGLEYIGTNSNSGFLEISSLTGSPTLAISNYKARHLNAAFRFNDDVTGQTFTGFDMAGNGVGIDINQGSAKVNTFLDSLQGNQTPVNYTNTSSLGTALLACSAQLESSVNFQYRLVDTNNGNRKSGYSGNYIYSGTLSSGVANQTIVTGIYHKAVTGSSPALDNRLPYVGVARLYGYQDYSINITSSLKQSVPISAVIDGQITQTDKNIVYGYEGFSFNAVINTLFLFNSELTNSQIYDRIKAYLADNLDILEFVSFSKVANRLTINWSLLFSVALAPGGTIAFEGSTLDLSITTTQPRSFEISSNSVVLVANGTTDLSAWTFASGATINLRGGATAATVQVTASQLANITAGSGVTLEAPPTTLTLSVVGPTDYYVGIYTSGGTRLNTSDTGLQTGTYTYTYSGGSSLTGVIVRVRRQGWTDFRTTVSLTSNVDVSARLLNLLNPDGSQQYTGTTTTGFSIDLSGSIIFGRVGNGPVSAQVGFDMFEDAKVSIDGMAKNSFQPTYVKIDGFVEGLFLPSGVRTIRNTSGDANAELSGFWSQADSLLIDNTNGDIIAARQLGDWTVEEREQIRYRLGIDGSESAPVVNSPDLGGALTTQQATQLAELWATLESAGVFSSAALVNAPAGSGGGGVTAEEIRQEIDNNSTQLAAIKAKTDPLTFTTAGRVDSTVVDKTGFSLSSSQTFNLTGNISGSVGSVTNAVSVGSIANNAITGASLASTARQAFVDSMLLSVTGDGLGIISAPLTSPVGLVYSLYNLTEGSFVEIKGPNFDSITDSLEAIRDATGVGIVAPEGWITAASITNEAVTKVQEGLSTHTAEEVWEVANRGLTDKDGFTLSSSGVASIEAALINEGDGQQLIDAIIQVINSNLDLPLLELTAIAQAVRSELSTELGRIDAAISTRLASGDYTPSDNAGIAELQDRLTTLRASYLDKLNVAGDISTFDPSVDVVSRVSLVDVTTTNTDMRGTNDALLASNYIAPDNLTISQIPTYFSDLVVYGDENWSSNDLSSIQANVGLLLDANKLTLNKPVTYSETSIVIGANEVVIDLVTDKDSGTVTATRSV